jgi:hypothetical protein
MIVLIQLCVATFLALYSFAVSAGDDRDVDDFAKYEQAWQQIDRPQVDYTIQPERIARLAHDAVVRADHFSNTVLIASIALFGFCCIQLWAIAKLPKTPMPTTR